MTGFSPLQVERKRDDFRLLRLLFLSPKICCHDAVIVKMFLWWSGHTPVGFIVMSSHTCRMWTRKRDFWRFSEGSQRELVPSGVSYLDVGHFFSTWTRAQCWSPYFNRSFHFCSPLALKYTSQDERNSQLERWSIFTLKLLVPCPVKVETRESGLFWDCVALRESSHHLTWLWPRLCREPLNYSECSHVSHGGQSLSLSPRDLCLQQEMPHDCSFSGERTALWFVMWDS